MGRTSTTPTSRPGLADVVGSWPWWAKLAAPVSAVILGATMWVTTKARWGLTADPAEVGALCTMLASC